MSLVNLLKVAEMGLAYGGWGYHFRLNIEEKITYFFR